MNNQPRNLANKLTENNNDNDNNNEETLSANPVEDEPKEEADVAAEDEPIEKENIKSVELTGRDAANFNQNTTTKKAANTPAAIGSSSGNNNLTKKKNNNPSRNLTQKQSANGNANPNINVATEEESGAGDKNVMRSLNKVAMNLLNHQIVMKLFHFQTELYGAHKASDAYLEKFASTMDKFLEIAQGIYGRLTIKKFKLEGSSHTDENIMKHIEGIIMLLRTGIDDVLDNYTDLINVRDELVGDAEQLKYLLTFK